MGKFTDSIRTRAHDPNYSGDKAKEDVKALLRLVDDMKYAQQIEEDRRKGKS